jgi:predicted AAA+ superfamily ATPase
MISRKMQTKLISLARTFPAIAILGPRQAGKTTLAQAAFPDYYYVSLEDFSQREFAQSEPNFFLQAIEKYPGMIIDEVQHVPQLLSALQTKIDASQKMGQYIITGSQNYLLNEKITQTLAGRIAILHLLPLSIQELKEDKSLPDHYETFIFKGGYPRIYAHHVPPTDWYPNYIHTYIERDVRQIKNVTDLHLFQRFMKLCAGRIGQVINFSDLGRDCGLSYQTMKAWLSILESSFIIFTLSPFYESFKKRLVKSPKLYFYDTGVACSLLGIESERQLETHYLKGNLFESMMISEFLKERLNEGLQPNCYFWRDQGHEIDCLIESAGSVIPIEIKSSRSVSSDFFDGLRFWSQLVDSDPQKGVLVYGGENSYQRKFGKVVSWTAVPSIFNKDDTLQNAPI